MANLNTLARTLRSLQKPGKPLVLANVYDYPTADAVASLPSSHAIATASYAVARTFGVEDDDMTLEQNLAVAKLIGKAVAKHGKPLTVDLQDGYGNRLEEAIKGVVAAGAVGVNLEDCDKDAKKMYSLDEASDRVRRAIKAASGAGVPDFVVNARCDTLLHEGEMDEVIQRGKEYLDAGAASVFVWGGRERGTSKAEVERMVNEFDGRLNVSLRWDGGLTVAELAKIGVARISVGPTIQFFAVGEFTKKAAELLKQAE